MCRWMSNAGLGLPQRLCAEPAGGRAGGVVHDRAPGVPGPVAGDHGEDRHRVSPVGRTLRRGRAHPGDPVRQEGPQDRRDAPAPGRAGGDGSLGGGGDRGGARVPERVRRQPAARRQRPAVVLLHQSRPAGYLFLLLPVGPAVRSGVHQDLCLLPVSDQVWVNGHEWAKRQATQAGIGFTALSNGFATCTSPEALQAICDRLGPGAITVFFERWMSVLPLPLTDADRAAGYWWELSMRQVETSRTIVFDAPRRARAFVEALVVDNLDVGRPDSVELIFTGKHERRGRPRKEPQLFKTKVVTRDTEVTINAFFKHS